MSEERLKGYEDGFREVRAGVDRKICVWTNCAIMRYNSNMAETHLPPNSIPNSKKCTSCRRVRASEDFTTNWRIRDGLNDQCKDCANQYRRLKYATSRLKAKAHSPAGRPPTEYIDPETFLWNLTNHNLRELKRMSQSGPFVSPAYPYKKMLYLRDVNTQESFVVRIFFKSPELTEFIFSKPNDRILVGMDYFGPYDLKLERIIFETVMERDLRII